MAYKKQSQDSKLDLPKPTDQTDGIQLSRVDSDPLEIRRQGRLLWRKKNMVKSRNNWKRFEEKGHRGVNTKETKKLQSQWNEVKKE